MKAAKETFGENFAIGDDTVDIMFDFFDSDAWQKYKNSKYSYYNEEELRGFVESVDKEGITGDELKRILVLIEGGSSLRKAVEIVKGK